MQCVEVRCNLLQCVVVCCTVFPLFWVAFTTPWMRESWIIQQIWGSHCTRISVSCHAHNVTHINQSIDVVYVECVTLHATRTCVSHVTHIYETYAIAWPFHCQNGGRGSKKRKNRNEKAMDRLDVWVMSRRESKTNHDWVVDWAVVDVPVNSSNISNVCNNVQSTIRISVMSVQCVVINWCSCR